jgi:ribonuclease PH
MRRKEDRPLQKVTLNLFAGDYNQMQALYPRAGAGKIIRELVRRHLRDNESRHNRPASDLAIDLDVLEEDGVTQL